MKAIKKIFSLMLVFLVGFALTLPAGASDKVDPKDNPDIDLSKTTGSITINKEGSTFSIYKILDAAGKEGQNVYNYTVNGNFTGLIGDDDQKYSLKDIADMPNQLNINNYDGEGNLIGVTDPITEETSVLQLLHKLILKRVVYNQLLQFLLVEQGKQKLL